MAHRCASAAAAATTTAAAEEVEATTPPTLVSGASDIETFFGRYRVRARQESEIGLEVGGITEDIIAFSFGEEEKMEGEQEKTADDDVVGSDDPAAVVNLGGGLVV